MERKWETRKGTQERSEDDEPVMGRVTVYSCATRIKHQSQSEEIFASEPGNKDCILTLSVSWYALFAPTAESGVIGAWLSAGESGPEEPVVDVGV